MIMTNEFRVKKIGNSSWFVQRKCYKKWFVFVTQAKWVSIFPYYGSKGEAEREMNILVSTT